MATGDNTLTAISVGRQCNILQEKQKVYFGDIENNRIVWKNSNLLIQDLGVDSSHDTIEIEEEINDDMTQVPWENDDKCGVALNGKMLSFMIQNKDEYELVLNKTLKKAQVYARMSPDDKANLVENLQEIMKV